MISQYIYQKGLISYLFYNILENYSDRTEKDIKISLISRYGILSLHGIGE